MSRGHEVKSVQEQWLDAEAAKDAKRKPKKTAEQMELDKQRESIELSRTRIARELAETKSDRRREQLQAALKHLDGELAKLR
jgi:galactokinase